MMKLTILFVFVTLIACQFVVSKKHHGPSKDHDIKDVNSKNMQCRGCLAAEDGTYQWCPHTPTTQNDYDGKCIPINEPCPTTFEFPILMPVQCHGDDVALKTSCSECLADGYTWCADDEHDDYSGSCIALDSFGDDENHMKSSTGASHYRRGGDHGRNGEGDSEGGRRHGGGLSVDEEIAVGEPTSPPPSSPATPPAQDTTEPEPVVAVPEVPSPEEGTADPVVDLPSMADDNSDKDRHSDEDKKKDHHDWRHGAHGERRRERRAGEGEGEKARRGGGGDHHHWPVHPTPHFPRRPGQPGEEPHNPTPPSPPSPPSADGTTATADDGGAAEEKGHEPEHEHHHWRHSTSGPVNPGWGGWGRHNGGSATGEHMPPPAGGGWWYGTASHSREGRRHGGGHHGEHREHGEHGEHGEHRGHKDRDADDESEGGSSSSHGEGRGSEHGDDGHNGDVDHPVAPPPTSPPTPPRHPTLPPTPPTQPATVSATAIATGISSETGARKTGSSTCAVTARKTVKRYTQCPAFVPSINPERQHGHSKLSHSLFHKLGLSNLTGILLLVVLPAVFFLCCVVRCCRRRGRWERRCAKARACKGATSGGESACKKPSECSSAAAPVMSTSSGSSSSSSAMTINLPAVTTVNVSRPVYAISITQPLMQDEEIPSEDSGAIQVHEQQQLEGSQLPTEIGEDDYPLPSEAVLMIDDEVVSRQDTTEFEGEMPSQGFLSRFLPKKADEDYQRINN